MWDGFDKRKFPRLNLRCEVTLLGMPQNQVLRTQTENVGAGGVCLILERSLERFSQVSVRFEIDPNLPWIECNGKVVWAVPSRKLGGKHETFDIGIEFVGLDTGHQELIRSYVESRVEAG